MSPGKSAKLLWVALAIVLLVPVHFIQLRMNRDRVELGLTRVSPPENAPPVLAFTTVALGSFRGLIANALWIRAVDLQDQGKYFEMIQLADWITKLQPTFATVWVHQAWNLVYNISIKFREPEERWRWVISGIELLRDRGLRYNPTEPLIYRELAWFFQHKIGYFLDDAHNYYKQFWAEKMISLFGPGKPNYEALINPQTEEQKARAKRLRDEFKMDPQFMKVVDETYGPLEWRLPETHAIYWAMRGLQLARKEELIVLRRVVFQSMQLAFQRGRLIENPFDHIFEYGPNLDIIEKANQAYLDMMDQDAEYRDHINTGYRNFLRDTVYFLYTHNRLTEARKWFQIVQEKYPDKPLLMNDPTSLPGTLTLDQYAVLRVAEDVSETSTDRVKAILQGLIKKSYYNLAIGEDDQAAGYSLLAQKVWQRFESEVPDNQRVRIGLPSLQQLRQTALDQITNPPTNAPPAVFEMVARLRAKLGITSPTNNPAPPASVPPATPLAPPQKPPR
jgi:hypothetical protein